MKALISINTVLLDQAITFIQQHTAHDYTRPCEAVFSSTIGQHIRHCVEHYEEFLRGMNHGSELDYDKRPRDLTVETDPLEAIRRLEGIRSSIERQLTECRGLIVWDNGVTSPANSSASREIQFLISHTIHHFALISVIASLSGLRVPSNFGVAPSTLKFRESA